MKTNSTSSSQPQPLIAKNPWVQGIRGICVASVLGFHFFPESIKYGYLGVDGFFALSGYLLLPKLLGELNDSTNLFKKCKTFLENRIKRLFPVFQIFLVISLLTLFLFGHPENIKDILGMTGTGLIGLGNFGAYRFAGDYFSPSTNPLIHIWSLSAELQCYVISVFLVLALKKFRMRQIKIIIFIFAVILYIANFLSIVYPNTYAIIGFSNGPAFAYYSPIFRLLEFLMGGIFAIYTRTKKEKSAVLSLCALSFYSCIMHPNSITCGLSVSVVTGALVSMCNAGKQLPQVLAPIKWVGDSSYSIYLYHLPILYFTNMYINSPSRNSVGMILSVAAGGLSYKKIELQSKFKSMKLIISLQVICTFIIIFLLWISANSYFGALKTVDLPPYAGSSSIYSKSFMNTHCISNSPCKPNDSGNNNGTAILIGDSHAEMFSEILTTLSNAHNTNLEIWTTPGCRLILHASIRSYGSQDCPNRNQALLTYLKTSNPEVIVLSQAVYRSDDLVEMKNTLRVFTNLGIPIYLIGSIPNFADSQNFMKVPPLISGRVNYEKKFKLVDMDLTNEKSIAAFETYAKALGVHVIDTRAIFCKRGICTRYRDGKWLYFDNSHLSVFGGKYLEATLNREIFQKLTRYVVSTRTK